MNPPLIQSKFVTECTVIHPERRARTRPIPHWKACLTLSLALTFLGQMRALAQSRPNQADLHGQVIDENALPVARVEIVLHLSGGPRTFYADLAGRFELLGLDESKIHMTISKPGFFRLDDRVLDLTAGSNEVSITLNH